MPRRSPAIDGAVLTRALPLPLLPKALATAGTVVALNNEPPPPKRERGPLAKRPVPGPAAADVPGVRNVPNAAGVLFVLLMVAVVAVLKCGRTPV